MELVGRWGDGSVEDHTAGVGIGSGGRNPISAGRMTRSCWTCLVLESLGGAFGSSCRGSPQWHMETESPVGHAAKSVLLPPEQWGHAFE